MTSEGGNPGACGQYHSDSDSIIALDYRRYGNLGVQSQYCGRCELRKGGHGRRRPYQTEHRSHLTDTCVFPSTAITITNTNTGATATGIVADACPTCSNENSLDLSLGLFQQLGPLSDGVRK